MNASDDPKHIAELLDWLALNLDECLTHVPSQDQQAAQAQWKTLARKLQADPGSGESFSNCFAEFLESLFKLPGMESQLPPGFNDFLAQGARQPTRKTAEEIYRNFNKTLVKCVNNLIEDEDEQETMQAIPAARQVPKGASTLPVDRGAST